MESFGPSSGHFGAGRMPRVGDVIAGVYYVEKVLGVGGMGVVVAASDTRSGQRVALKIMLPHQVEAESGAARFLREAQATASLKSDHVTRIFDAGCLEDGRPYLVMELLDGRDLDQIARSRGTLPIEEAVGYVLQACEAVAEAHALGIIHRDLKPANLFLTNQPGGLPIIKVLDFGISKTTKFEPDLVTAGGLTTTGQTLGSPEYMSPEQLRDSRRVDSRADIWSLGMILHRLLAGRVAFEAETVGGILAMLVADSPTPLRKRRPDAPRELEAIVLRCLEKDVTHRFQHVGQLARALQPFGPPYAQALVARIMEHIQDAPPILPAALRVSSPLPIALYQQQPPGDSQTPASWGSTESGIHPAKKPMRLGLVVGAVVAVATIGVGLTQLIRASSAPEQVAMSTATGAAVTTTSQPTVPVEIQPAQPAMEQVTIHLILSPPEAVVELDGVLTLDNPIRLAKGDEVHKLVVRAGGYATEEREVKAQVDASISVFLKPDVPQSTVRPTAPQPATTISKPSNAKLKGPMETDL